MTKSSRDSTAVDARLVALDEQLRAMFAAKADEPAPVRLVDLVDQLETAARLKRPLRRGAPSTARQADTAAPTRRRG